MTPMMGNVLCVDDEPGILRSLEWLLRKKFAVKTALGSAAALEALQHDDFDVIISDQRMPGMSGAQFLAEARRISPRSMRLLLTGYSDMQSLLDSVNEGEVWRFIKKPWDSRELVALVDTAVSISREAPRAPEAESLAFAEGGTVLLISNDDEMRSALEDALGSETRILQATDLARAIDLLASDPISTIVTEARIGQACVASFISLLKRRRPEIVSVIISDESDAEQIVNLINQGQIYRFTGKPLKKGYLRLIVTSALGKHRQLQDQPGLQQRHSVQIDAETEQLLREKVRALTESALAAGTPPPDCPPDPATENYMLRTRAGFQKLFCAQ